MSRGNSSLVLVTALFRRLLCSSGSMLTLFGSEEAVSSSSSSPKNRRYSRMKSVARLNGEDMQRGLLLTTRVGTLRRPERESGTCFMLAFRFVLRIMGKCASRSGSRRDPDCGMVYGGMKRAWSSLKEFPGTESFRSDLPASTELHIKSQFYTRLFLPACRSNLHEHGRTGQARARVERSTLSTFISTRYVLDPTTGFVSCGVKK